MLGGGAEQEEGRAHPALRCPPGWVHMTPHNCSGAPRGGLELSKGPRATPGLVLIPRVAPRRGGGGLSWELGSLLPSNFLESRERAPGLCHTQRLPFGPGPGWGRFSPP